MVQSLLMTRPSPLGLVLPGGGALCSWQGGVLEALAAANVPFDHVVGISGGALNGGAYFAGRFMDEMRHWRDTDGIRALRFSPKLSPFSLFKIDPAWELVDYALDEDRAKREAICDLTVLSFRERDRRTVYSRFSPNGARGWDGPLATRLVASCAIPVIYPPVNIDGERYRDGGSPGVEPARFDALAHCGAVVVITPVRPDERGRKHWGPVARHEQRIREVALDEVEQGLAPLRKLANPPRVIYIFPSKVLDFSMLGFTSRNCGPAVEQGTKDARTFLASPRAALVKPAPASAALAA